MQEGDKDVNVLFDTQAGKPVFTLTGFSAFQNENHGGFYGVYNEKETLGFFHHLGKWETRAVSVVNIETGAQLSITEKLRTDGKKRVARFTKRTGHVFDVLGAKFEKNSLFISVVSNIPKDEFAKVYYYQVRYDVKSSGDSIKLSSPKYTRLDKHSAWVYPPAGN